MTISVPDEQSEERINKAIETLTPVELLRLGAFAEWRMRALGRKAQGRTGDDLLQEAIAATLDGRRAWRGKVDLLRHLCGAMRSISTSWRSQRGEEYLASELCDEEGSNILESLVVANHLDDGLAAHTELATILALFAGDRIASMVLASFYLGYTAKEAQVVFGLSAKDYSAAVRRIRRRAKSVRNKEFKLIESGKHEPEPVI